MSDFVPITPGTGANIETLQQSDGRQRQVMSMADFSAVLHGLLQQMIQPPFVDLPNQRMRVVVDAITGGLTLSTVTTVAGVTTVTTVATVTSVTAVQNLVQVGGRPADELIVDGATAAWAISLRGRIA